MTGTMKAVVLKGVREIEIQEFPIPAVPEDKVLVKIEASALCTWEQRVYTGVKKVEFPFVGGHEMSAVILEAGSKVDQRHWKAGDKVVVGVTLPCKNCYQCKSGNEQNCEHFNHSQPIEGLPYKGMGGLCSHLIVHPLNMFKYSNVTPEEASLAEPLSCVVHSVETGAPAFGENVLVVGCGIMGLLHVILSAKRGASVIACDMNEARLELAKKLGARFTINPERDNLYGKIAEYTDGIKAQVIFDTTPVSGVVEELVKCVSNKGRLVLYSSFYPDTPVSVSPDWLHKSGAALLGTANSNTQDFQKAAMLLSAGIVNVSELVSEVYELKDVKQAFESASKGDKYRVIVKF